MPPPTTLTGYHTEVKAQADLAVADLQAQVAQLGQDAAAAQAALAAATGAVAADQATNASLRTQLAQAALPSDATNLVAQLQANLIQTRIDQAALGQAADAAAAATRAQQQASAALVGAQAAQAGASGDLAASVADDQLVAQWTAAASGPAVTAALAAAQPASVTPAVAAATTALEKIIGSGMLALFEHRRSDFEADQAAAADGLALARAKLDDALTTQQPLVGATATQAVAYQQARQALADLAQVAVPEVAAAVSSLASGAVVGTPGAAIGPLPGDELAALAAAKAAAAGQVTPENKVFTAKGKVRADQSAIDTTTLTALETDPDFDAGTDPSTQSDRTKLANDQAAVVTAVGAVDYVALDDWEVLIPQAVLDLVVAVVEAESTLATWGAVTPAAVVSALATAESAYAAALDAQWTYQRSLDALDAEVARRQADADAEARVASQREDAAIRRAS